MCALMWLKQKKAIRIIAGAKYTDHTEPIFRRLKLDLDLLKLDNIYNIEISKYVFQLNEGSLPKPLRNLINPNNSKHDTRNSIN